ncbi:MAG: hypothetical protein QM805_05560 [Pseudomonas sp.]
MLPGVDHREASFSPAAFAATWRFLTGAAPSRTDVASEAAPLLDGSLSGLGLAPGDPASGETSPATCRWRARGWPSMPPTLRDRRAPRPRRCTAGPSAPTAAGAPFAARPDTAYEFEITAAGYATTHIYRSPSPRGSTVVNLRPERIAAADRDAGAIVIFTRPRGYFDAQRDRMRFDGQASLPGVPPRGAGVSASKARLQGDAQRSVTGEFNGERITGRSWPAATGHVTLLELSY